MPRRAELAGRLLRHIGAFVVATFGTVGVFGLSLGMNAQVRKKETEVVTTVEAAAVAARPKSQPQSRQKRSSPVKKARKSAPSPAPMLAASLGGLDFGLGGAADVALAEATEALVGAASGTVMDEDSVQEAPTATQRNPPSYPARARSQGQTGYVTLTFVVDVDGSVQDVHVLESVPPGVFDAAATDAVTGWSFDPGRNEGSPVAVRVRQTLHFELE